MCDNQEEMLIDRVIQMLVLESQEDESLYRFPRSPDLIFWQNLGLPLFELCHIQVLVRIDESQILTH
jgi:hypothetical protein